MRKPLIPSWITTFIKIFIRRRPQTSVTLRFAAPVSRQGKNIDLPLLKARQSMS